MKTAETSFFQERLHDARLSFVSGHASLSAYSMTFTVLYLQVMIVIMLVMIMILIIMVMIMIIMMMIMTFTVLYLQRGMGSKDFRLVKPLIQVKYFIFMETRKHEYFSGWLRSVRLLHMSHKSVRLQTSPRGGNGDNNINSTKSKNHLQDVVGGALLGGGLAFLAWSFLLARQTGPVTSATSTTSLLAVSTSRLYSREDLSVP